MKPFKIILFAIFLCMLSCKEKSEHETNKIFNEGVSVSLLSGEAEQKGDFEKAKTLNKKAIDKFKETYKLDSTNTAIRSALGHCFYLDKQYPEAIFWFDQANKINGDAAVNYRELGLSKISIGKIEKGKFDLDKAFALDSTQEIRRITIQDLVDIGELAFSYGDGYIEQGEPEKGKEYKTLSLTVYIMAFEYDQTNKQISKRIAELADKFGDKETSDYYKSLSKS